MSRGLAGKELLVILLDVGPHMHFHLNSAGKALFNLVESKILFKPSHEVAIILFGTTDTRNALNADMAAQGHHGQYENIFVANSLQSVDLSYLSTFTSLPKGEGVSDYMDALTVSLDVLIKAVDKRLLDKCPKRVVMISSLQGQAKPLDEAFRDALVHQLRDKQVKLEVICIEPPDEEATPHKARNTNEIHELLAEVGGVFRSVSESWQLQSVFKAREITPVSLFRGNLTIGKNIEIPVRVYKKTAKEPIPSLKMYSDRSSVAEATHEVVRDTEYKAPSNPDEPVPPEERVKAYRYGKQHVPMPREAEEMLSYVPDKGMTVLGFVADGVLPRQQMVKDTNIVLPEPDSPSSCAAVSALARAMARTNKHAVVRCVLRARASVSLALLTPLLSTNASTPDAFIMCTLPFADDLRAARFPPLPPHPNAMPSRDQHKAAHNLVLSMDLGGPPGKELLPPDSTPNPTLQRFFTTLGIKALDPSAEVPETDDLFNMTFEPQFSRMPETALPALREFAGLVTCKSEPAVAVDDTAGMAESGEERGAKRSRLGGDAAEAMIFDPEAPTGLSVATTSVSMSHPVEDLEEMVKSGRGLEAVEQMKGVVTSLVETSVGDRLYEKAERCVRAMRAACVQLNKAGPFNAFLRELASRFEHHSVYSAFWARLIKAEVTLISLEEAPTAESAVPASDAAEFLRSHSPQTAPQVQAVPAEEEDLFAGME